MIVILLITAESEINELWMQHFIRTFPEPDYNTIIIAEEHAAANENLGTLKAKTKITLPHGENPYFCINKIVRDTGTGYFTIIKPNSFIDTNAFFDLAAEMEKGDIAVGLATLKHQIDDDEQTEPPVLGIHPPPIPMSYPELLYDIEYARIQIIWSFSIHELVGGFSEQLTLFNEREFCLRASEKGEKTLSIPGGYFCYSPGEIAAEYRQSFYEEELSVKEEHIRNFLSEKYDFSDKIKEKLLFHAKLVSLFFKKLQSGDNEISLQEFDQQVFFYALFLAKNGDVKASKEIIMSFLDLEIDSRNCVHLYRILLTPFLNHEPLIEQPTRSTPLVSIPMALYNHGHYLDWALQSLFAQTLTDWELVIINDGSTDRSLKTAKQLLARYNDTRIRIVSKANEGLPKTRTRGMQETTAPYICQLDPDDMIAPSYLEKAVKMLEEDPDLGWVTPKTLVFGGHNHLTWCWDYNFVYSLIKCPSPALAVFRRSMWEEIGGYKDDMSCREDWEFWIRAGESGWYSKTTEEPLFIYRHAFKRWGELNKFNISSKIELVKLHPWWYKKLPDSILREMFTIHTVGAFPSEILEPDAVERIKKVTGDKSAIRKVMVDLRKAIEGNASCKQ